MKEIITRRRLLAVGGGLIAAPAIIRPASANLLMAPTSGGGDTPLVLTVTPGPSQNNINQSTGMRITVAGTPITVTSIGRYKLSGNSATHTVGIMDSSGTTVLVSGSIDLSTGSINSFVYGTVSPTVLSASTQYIVAALEQAPGDSWADDTTTLTTTAAASYDMGTYAAGTSLMGVYTDVSGMDTGYPLDIKYH